ncbi:single-stranded DNA-binding protein [Agromyces endophyticus]|uniref:single-stranded DNA-binding protein n=1 Tax=Agromyces sp. H17E-10 TaxID=2932244 RepID=UPI001FD318B3|nr:single-stranded DNA-binding protein [Agromyces sp. H17E-10]UOQ88930.1 single-stranded DNA-binding protein [Agromyces sp. H17E-10]
MTDSITVTGIVGTDPTQKVIGDGVVITSFRLASNRRYFDKAKGTWESTETNWFTVSAFRQLGHNAGFSVRKGQHVVVQGRLRVRAWEAGGKSGTSVDIEADAIGHDMAWCISSYVRTQSESRSAESGAGDAADDVAAPVDDAGWSSVSSAGEFGGIGDGIGDTGSLGLEPIATDDELERAYAESASD